MPGKEAVKIMHILPCVVIRGISGYANENVPDGEWNGRATAAAAAYARLLLKVVQSTHDMGFAALRDAETCRTGGDGILGKRKEQESMVEGASASDFGGLREQEKTPEGLSQ